LSFFIALDKNLMNSTLLSYFLKRVLDTMKVPKQVSKLGVMAHTYNPSPWEAETGKSYDDLEASLG
jgi:hypothetical protein